MKITTAFLSFTFIAAVMPSFASAQTKPGPPPSVKGTPSVRAKGIPPAPQIPSVRSRRKQASPGAMAGLDASGRKDLSAKSVAFYPVSKGSIADAQKQSSATRSSKRVAKQQSEKDMHH